jgi:hypothetical protein
VSATAEAVVVDFDITPDDISPPVVTESLPPTLDQIRALEAAIKAELPTYDVEALTRHHFCEGMYARELFIPAGGVIVGKTHARQNFFLLARGDLTVWTEQGMKRVRAPFMVVTQPGEKRVGYAHEDSVTLNFHANPDDCADMAVLESRYIIPDAAIEADERPSLENAL